MLQQPAGIPVDDGTEFGLLIFHWRGLVKRPKLLEHLPGWSKDTLHRLEKGEIAPSFDQLRPLFRALWLANAKIPYDGTQLYVKHARQKIESKRTHRDYHTDEEWAELSYDLTFMDRTFRNQQGIPASSSPLLMDSTHLVGRENWREDLKRMLIGPERKKVIVIKGPSGVGKSSEVNRLAVHLLGRNTHRAILCDLHLAEHMHSPEEALNFCLGTVFSALGYVQAQGTRAFLDERVMVLLEQIEKAPLPVILLIDHAETILNKQGRLASCWERFLTRFLKFQHRSSLILATKQWPGWFAGELRFLAEVSLSPLTIEQGVVLLQQLGLSAVPPFLLQTACEKVRGIPLCLEWIAALARQPFLLTDPEDAGQPFSSIHGEPDLSVAVRRLLAEPHIFGGSLAEEIVPLLERILSNHRLSPEAYRLLQSIAISTVPLARPALDVLCPQWERIIRELQRASLLVAYSDRIQALPSVAAAVIRELSTQDRALQEKALIGAYQVWLNDGTFYENEKGAVVNELTILLLSHQYLLAAAQLLIRHGWLAFNLGHASHLAWRTRTAIQGWESLPREQHQNQEEECGKCLLYYFMSPYLNETIDVDARAGNYQRLLEHVISGVIAVQPPTELFVVRHLMFYAMKQKHFSEAKALVDTCEQRLASQIESDPDLQASILEKWGFLYTNWCEDAEGRGDFQASQALRETAIAVYRRSIAVLTEAEGRTNLLKRGILKKRLARAQTNLGFHLSRVDKYDEAINVLSESVLLKEQGFAEPGSLAASYGDLSQAFLGAGRLIESEHYDRLAWNEIQHLADAGDTISQETAWIYHVNRGRLYVKQGKLDEAESLLRGAIPNLPDRWEMYRTFALQALEEIKQLRGRQLELARLHM